MYKKYPTLLFFILVSCTSQDSEISYPETKKIEFSETIHGYVISDSYRWLEDFTSEESTDWVDRQNNFTKDFIKNNKYKKGLESYLNNIWES